MSESTASELIWDLEPEHSGAVLRLERLLWGKKNFTLAFLEYSDSAYREKVSHYLSRALDGGSEIVDASAVAGNFAELERRIEAAAAGHRAVQVIGLDRWPSGEERLWQAFNYHRELIGQICPAPMLLWILRGRMAAAATEAPDFWSWRSGVFDFGSRPIPFEVDQLKERSIGYFSNAPASQREERLAEIDDYFMRHGEANHSAEFRLLVERGQLLLARGEIAEARSAFEAAIAGYRDIDDSHGEATAKRWLARLQEQCGELGEALRALREEILPIFDKLKEPRERAITMGQIADILASRGDLDEALRIRREEELPVYEQLGDVRERAIVTAKIGQVLWWRGDLASARQHFEAALQDAERLKISEVSIIGRDLEKLEEAIVDQTSKAAT